jgi:hypothetical protein
VTATIWQNMVQDLLPDIDKLTQILQDGPKIKSSIREIDGEYDFYLEELWPDDVTFRYQVNNNLQDRVLWCTERLNIWPRCSRIGYDTWRFSSLDDLEKFSILYNLVWAQ